MGDAGKDASDVLTNASHSLQQAKFGVQDIRDAILPRKIAGIRNIATYGRACTRTLQRLKSIEPDFEDWYVEYREEMENDPLMQYFWDLRNEVLKQGKHEIGWELEIKNLQYPDDIDMDEKPDHARAFFIGDQLGGIGWEIEHPDGRTDNHYIALPEDIVEQEPLLSNPPAEHLGEDISDAETYDICKMYVDYIDSMVQEARASTPQGFV